MATILEPPVTLKPAESRNTVATRPYFVTITRRIPHAIDANDAMRAAEIGAGELVDIEVAEDFPLP